MLLSTIYIRVLQLDIYFSYEQNIICNITKINKINITNFLRIDRIKLSHHQNERTKRQRKKSPLIFHFSGSVPSVRAPFCEQPTSCWTLLITSASAKPPCQSFSSTAKIALPNRETTKCDDVHIRRCIVCLGKLCFRSWRFKLKCCNRKGFVGKTNASFVTTCSFDWCGVLFSCTGKIQLKIN